MERDIYQKQYDFELEQRNYIASAINTPIMALTILGGALSTVILGYSYTWAFITYFFIALVIFSLIALIFSIYYVFRTFYGYDYAKLPSSAAMIEYKNKLIEYNRKNGKSDKDANEAATNDYIENIILRLSSAADRNSNNNIERGNYLHKSSIGIGIAFVFIFITACLYTYQKLNKENDFQKVQIIGNVTINQGKENMNDKTTHETDSLKQNINKPIEAEISSPVIANPKPECPENVSFKGTDSINHDVKKIISKETK